MSAVSGTHMVALVQQLQARNRELEAQLQSLQQGGVQRLQQMEQQLERTNKVLTSAEDRAQRLQQRLRIYEYAEGDRVWRMVRQEQLDHLLTLVAPATLMLVDRATYAEVLPSISSARVSLGPPHRFKGAFGLKELTLELKANTFSSHPSAQLEAQLRLVTHLTGLLTLNLRGVSSGTDARPPKLTLSTTLVYLYHLKTLRIESVSPRCLSNLVHFKQLQALEVLKCRQMEWNELPALPRLTFLRVRLLDEGVLLSNLTRQTALHTLHLVDYKHMTNRAMDVLARLTGLQELSLERCRFIRDPGTLSSLTLLTLLDLSHAVMGLVWNIARMHTLRALRLRAAATADSHDSEEQLLEDVPPLRSLSQLVHLDLSATLVHDVSPISRLRNLQHLDLAGTFVNDLAPLSELRSLRRLDVSDTDIETLEHLPLLSSLQWLDISFYPANLAEGDSDEEPEPTMSVAPLSALTSLTSLTINDRSQVLDMELLAGLPHLTVICREH